VELRDRQVDLDKRGVRVVVVSVDSAGESAELVRKLRLPFPIWSDVNRAAVKAWGVWDEGNDIAWPAAYVIGTDGQIVWRSLEEDYRVRPTIDRVLNALDTATTMPRDGSH